MLHYEHTKKNPNCSHSIKATTGTPILPEIANNGLNSSKTGDKSSPITDPEGSRKLGSQIS